MKLYDALSARNSARRRISTIRQVRRRWSGYSDSPINHKEFSVELNNIEENYHSIIDRVSKAIDKVELDV